jgi:hypothetical protein
LQCRQFSVQRLARMLMGSNA